MEKDEEGNIDIKSVRLKPKKNEKFIIVMKNDKNYNLLIRKKDGTIFLESNDEDVNIE